MRKKPTYNHGTDTAVLFPITFSADAFIFTVIRPNQNLLYIETAKPLFGRNALVEFWLVSERVLRDPLFVELFLLSTTIKKKIYFFLFCRIFFVMGFKFS